MASSVLVSSLYYLLLCAAWIRCTHSYEEVIKQACDVRNITQSCTGNGTEYGFCSDIRISYASGIVLYIGTGFCTWGLVVYFKNSILYAP